CKGWRRRFNSVPGHHHSKELADLASCSSSPLSVRSRDRLPSRLLFILDSEELSSTCLVSQSALSPLLSAGMAENRTEHCPCCGHAVIANGVDVKLECELDVAVAEQSLHGSRIGFDANEERCEAVAQIMEAK